MHCSGGLGGDRLGSSVAEGQAVWAVRDAGSPPRTLSVLVLPMGGSRQQGFTLPAFWTPEGQHQVVGRATLPPKAPGGGYVLVSSASGSSWGSLIFLGL